MQILTFISLCAYIFCIKVTELGYLSTSRGKKGFNDLITFVLSKPTLIGKFSRVNEAGEELHIYEIGTVFQNRICLFRRERETFKTN